MGPMPDIVRRKRYYCLLNFTRGVLAYKVSRGAGDLRTRRKFQLMKNLNYTLTRLRIPSAAGAGSQDFEGCAGGLFFGA